MKKVILPFLFLALGAILTQAQNPIPETTPEPKTFFKPKPVSRIGFFLQGNAESTLLAQRPVMVAGFAMGVSINHKYRVGLASDFLVTNLNVNPKYHIAPFTRMRWKMSYYGLFFDYTFFPTKIVSLNLGSVVGLGTIGKHGMDAAIADLDETVDDSRFFLMKPYIGAEFNLTKFLSIGAGGGYRFGLGSATEGIDTWGVSAPYGQLSLKVDISGHVQ
jgi:hypothetical protein